jgi:hypothetical protein
VTRSDNVVSSCSAGFLGLATFASSRKTSPRFGTGIVAGLPFLGLVYCVSPFVFSGISLQA